MGDIIRKLFNWLKQNYGFIFQEKNLVILLIIGLSIRLLIMPFTMMIDFSHQYYGTFQTIEAQALPAWDNVNPVSMDSLYLFMSFYNKVFPSMYWYNSTFIANQKLGFPSTLSSRFGDYTTVIQSDFLSHEPIFLKIFLLKLPFLIFDLGILFILPLFFKTRENKKSAFLFWLFNPIILVINFVFGAMEVMAVLFLVLALYQFSKDRLLAGLFFTCLAFLSKFETSFVIPFVIVFVLKRIYHYALFRKRIILSAGLIIFIGFFPILFFMTSLKIILKELIAVAWPYNYIFIWPIDRGGPNLYLFLIVYALILMFYIYSSDGSFENLWKFSLLGLLSFFALCYFHVQWFLIIMPFICFAVVANKLLWKAFLPLMISYFLIFIYWSNLLTVYLLAPINPEFFLNLPDVKLFISNFFNADILVNIFWTAFVATNIFFAYFVIKSIKLNNDEIEALYKNNKPEH